MFHESHYIIIDALVELGEAMAKDDEHVHNGGAEAIWKRIIRLANEVCMLHSVLQCVAVQNGGEEAIRKRVIRLANELCMLQCVAVQNERAEAIWN